MREQSVHEAAGQGSVVGALRADDGIEVDAPRVALTPRPPSAIGLLDDEDTDVVVHG